MPPLIGSPRHGSAALVLLPLWDRGPHNGFGSIGEEMWWGNDRLEFMEEYLTA